MKWTMPRANRYREKEERGTPRHVVGRPEMPPVIMGCGNVFAQWLVDDEQVSVNAIDKVNLRDWVWEL